MRWRILVGCGSARRSCAPRSHFLNSAVPVPYIYPPARFASWLHRNSRWPQHVGMLERAPADRYCLCVNRDDETLRGYCLSASRQLHKDATPRPRNSSFASPDCYVSSFASPDCYVGTERTFRHWCGVLAGIDAGLEPSAMTDYFRL